MVLNTLTAVSPIDGRYRKNTEVLAKYFSEFALIKYRVLVEVEYFIALSESSIQQLHPLDKTTLNKLRDIYVNFSEVDATWIKDKEKITNHDVKAVEYFLKEKFDQLGLPDSKEFIHFGLTSQDVNNTSVPLSLKDCLHEVFFAEISTLIERLRGLAQDWKGIPMLAHTHGQPASPTRLGKEIMVFVERLEKQFTDLKKIPFAAKFGGATGNFNAHHVAYPEINWKEFGDTFVNHQLGLSRSSYTTQIEHYDYLAALFDCLKRINTILIDFDRDVWTYISMGYFKQRPKKDEIGSSAMPHKVNPIDFENSEGNFGIANAVFEHLSAKLPISRLQRDLTDSTVLRNVGVPIAHSLIGIKSTLRGLDKIEVNEAKLRQDLENNWAVVAEAIQTILRRENYPNPYEKLKELTRTGEAIKESTIKDFIETLEVSESIKKELRIITPFNYTGISQL